jgi:hypothetical protein
MSTPRANQRIRVVRTVIMTYHYHALTEQGSASLAWLRHSCPDRKCLEGNALRRETSAEMVFGCKTGHTARTARSVDTIELANHQ